MKKRVTKIEKLLILILLFIIIGTPVVTITLRSISFVNNREITQIESEIKETQQTSRELEVKRQEKLTYEHVQGYAATGGLQTNQDNVKRID